MTRGFAAAVRLLTRIPLGRAGAGPDAMPGSIKWFPLVGGLIGLGIAAVYALAASVMPSLLSAATAVTLGILLTGALHEDGLADTADAFGAGVGREETLRILKDPTHGTYGVLALAAGFAIRTAALATLSRTSAFVVLPAVHAISRGAAISPMAILAPATGDGLAAAHVGSDLRRHVGIGLASAVLIGSLSLGPSAVPLILAAAVSVAAVAMAAKRRIGGFTGDVLGAAEQITEMATLALAASLTPDLAPAWWR